MNKQILIIMLLLTASAFAETTAGNLQLFNVGSGNSRGEYLEFNESKPSLKREISALRYFSADLEMDKDIAIRGIKQVALVINHTSNGEVSFQAAFHSIKESVVKSGVHDGLIIPALNLIDSYIVNGRKDLVANLSPVISGLNPKIGSLLRSNLNLETEFDIRSELQQKLSLVDSADFSDMESEEEFSRNFGLTSTVNPDFNEVNIEFFRTETVRTLGENTRGPREFEGDNNTDIEVFANPSGRGPIMGERVSSGNACMRGCIGGFVGGGFAGIPAGIPGIVFGGIGGGIAGCVSSCGGGSPEETPPVSTPHIDNPPTIVEPPVEDTPDDEVPEDETPDEEPEDDDNPDDDGDEDSRGFGLFSLREFEENNFMNNVRIRNNIRFNEQGL
ncbi:putative exported protein [Halobacteriovorax marinus SJ]|uniref:Exported protein n=1 Tax=Halobacteriovorax marinus (strain ATCC BAA-682 / DSM 15412 / SJ) TaxID=862908 RepID=E1X5T3_HALMS|nr:hypothetical protein [Halobacteriovorax marinus]CBW25650.1 putative exported protein [Halobacteriovorax marinus SJ]